MRRFVNTAGDSSITSKTGIDTSRLRSDWYFTSAATAAMNATSEQSSHTARAGCASRPATGSAISAIVGGLGVKISRTLLAVICWTCSPNHRSSYASRPELAAHEQARRGVIRNEAVSHRSGGEDGEDGEDHRRKHSSQRASVAGSVQCHRGILCRRAACLAEP